MTIVEALLQCESDRKYYITRLAWNKGYPTDVYVIAIKLLMTDSPDGSMIISRCEKGRCRAWNPRREDILADDWIVTE